jgi:hypothetical protein
MSARLVPALGSHGDVINALVTAACALQQKAVTGLADTQSLTRQLEADRPVLNCLLRHLSSQR